MQLHFRSSHRNARQIGALLSICFFALGTLQAQTNMGWQDLASGIILNFAPKQGIIPKFEPAAFTPDMKSMEGQKISITGYFLVLDARRSRFLLSKNPFASCFFCGNGGPETVMDLKFTKSYNFELDDVITVEGVLRLNESDPAYSYFILEKAVAYPFE